MSRIELTFKRREPIPDLAWAQGAEQASARHGEPARSGPAFKASWSASRRKNCLIIVGLVSEDGSMDGNDLRDYAQSNLEEGAWRASPGVGEVTRSSARQYSRCAVWLNPDKLTDYRLTVAKM